MKCRCLAVVLVTVVPALARAQNPQFTNCRSLELTGNFVAADEVLVNGQVCKVASQKNNPANPSATPDSAAEKNKALLGIVEPETLRAKDKATQSGAASVATTPAPSSGTPISPASNSTASGTPSQPNPFGTVQQGSLGAIARAYRKEGPPRANANQAGLLVDKKHNEEAASKASGVGTALMPAGDVEAGPPANRAVSSRTEAPKTTEKREIVAAAATPTLTAPAKVQPTANSEVPAVAPAPPAAVSQDLVPTTAPPVPIEPPAKAADSLAVATSTPQAVAAKPETKHASPEVLPVQPPTKPEMDLPAVTTSPAPVSETAQADTVATTNAAIPAQLEASPASTAPQIAGLEVEKPATAGTPAAGEEEAGANPDPQPLDSAAEIDAFREGQMPNCRKNISLGSMTKDNLFLSIPDWAMAWYGKNQKRFPGICFSNAIMPGARNFLVVFYTTPPAAPPVDAQNKTPEDKAPAELSSAKAEGSFTTSHGSMWHYSVEREVTTTITSVSADKAPHNQQPAVLFATAYTEQGTPVAQHRPAHPATIDKDKGKTKDSSKKGGKKKPEPVDPTSSVMADLLNQMVQDIAKH